MLCFQKLKKIALSSSILMLMSFGSTNYHGNYINNWHIDKLHQDMSVGEITKQDILSQFGAPSFTLLDNEDVWYYSSHTMRSIAIFKNVVSKRVVELTFNDNKLVNVRVPIDSHPKSKQQLRNSGNDVNEDNNISNDLESRQEAE